MKRTLLLVPLLAAALAGPLRADDILMRSGNDITGVRIERETIERIEYRKSGVASVQNVSTADVRDVRYGRTSAEFVQGTQLASQGDMLEAASYFVTAADDEGLPEHVRATALIEAADALFSNGNYGDSLGLYDRFLSEHRNSRHLARALMGRGRSLLFTRDYAGALAAFDSLKSEAQARKLGERATLDAEFFRLLTQEAQGSDVAKGYEDLRSRTAGPYQDIANRCALRLGRVHSAAGRARQAEQMFQEIIDSRLETDDDIVAGAFNGRGRVLFDRALAAQRGENGGPDPELATALYGEALLDFLRVFLNYRGVFREQPEALYWAGQCYLNLAALDPTDEEAQPRGLALLKACNEKYPDTEWGKKAADLL